MYVERAEFGVPDGYQTVPLFPSAQPAALSIGLLIAAQPEPGRSPLVVLRSLIDACVYLGVVTDAAGVVHHWVEVWVQHADEVDGTVSAVRGSLTNALLDSRWSAHARALRQTMPDGVFNTGFEQRHPAPMVLDLELRTLEPVRDQQGGSLTLCTDDAALASAGLPAYATSLHRYLWTGAEGAPRFYAVSKQSPTNDAAAPLTDLSPDKASDFNRGAGLLACRAFLPASFPEYLGVLNGGSWRGVLDGRGTVPIARTVEQALHADLQEVASDSGFGRMFLGRHGRMGRLVETFHLKLRCLADAVRAVRAQTEKAQVPHLRLSADSFRVRFSEQGAGLPSLWANRVRLCEPSDAVRLKLGATDTALYQPLSPPTTSVYRPAFSTDYVAGKGLVRIRRARAMSSDDDKPAGRDDASVLAVIEATVQMPEEVDPARRDLVWLRVRPGGQVIDLYGHAEADSALSHGELRFRSAEQVFPREVFHALTQAEGLSLPDCAYSVIPGLSSPCDLYAMGVVGVQTLLVNQGARLAPTLDELLSLGRWTRGGEPGTPVAGRIASAFAEDPRWMGLLGPHRLIDEPVTPEETLNLIPRELWWETLAALLRMFPGATDEGTCRDYTDARPGGLHLIYDPTLDALQRLIVQTRSLIVIDWHYNREVHGVLLELFRRR